MSRACVSAHAVVEIESVSSPRYCAPPTVLIRSRSRNSLASVMMSMGKPLPSTATMHS